MDRNNHINLAFFQQMGGTSMTEDQFSKDVVNNGWAVFDAQAIAEFVTDLTALENKGIAMTTEERDILEKGRKDISKLVLKTVVDKNGKTTRKWVKPYEEDKKEEKPKSDAEKANEASELCKVKKLSNGSWKVILPDGRTAQRFVGEKMITEFATEEMARNVADSIDKNRASFKKDEEKMQMASDRWKGLSYYGRNSWLDAAGLDRMIEHGEVSARSKEFKDLPINYQRALSKYNAEEQSASEVAEKIIDGEGGKKAAPSTGHDDKYSEVEKQYNKYVSIHRMGKTAAAAKIERMYGKDASEHVRMISNK